MHDMKRIEAARHALIDRGYWCLSSGRFGLPSYSDVEAWAKGRVLLYLLYDRRCDGWDVVTTLDPSNGVAEMWAAVDALEPKAA